MKRINIYRAVFLLSFVFLLSSCYDKNKPESESKKEKAEKIMRLYESYGWELCEDVTEVELVDSLSRMDYDRTKGFLEDLKKGWFFTKDTTLHKKDRSGAM